MYTYMIIYEHEFGCCCSRGIYISTIRHYTMDSMVDLMRTLTDVSES